MEGCALKQCIRALTMLLAVSAWSASGWAQSIPAWIVPNTAVSYNFYSAPLINGIVQPGAISGHLTMYVTDVSATGVEGSVALVFNGITHTDAFSCNTTGTCTGSYPGQFWVDPVLPTESMSSEPLTVRGTATSAITGVAGGAWTWTTMAYQDPAGCDPNQTPATCVLYQTTFDAHSGLILAYGEYHPSQELILEFAGLTGATLPTRRISDDTSDFDDNGKSDILLQNASGQAAIWLMNGATASSMAQVGTDPGPSWHAIGSGDFNGDGYSDILWQNTGSGEIYIWEMNGTKMIGGGSPGNPGTSWRAIGE
jgi:hypothetical protein